MIQFGPQTRKTVAVVGVLGAAVLAGCSGVAVGGDQQVSDPTPNAAAPTATTPAPAASSAGYADGTYMASGAYQTPETIEQIQVTLTLAGGVVTDVQVSGSPQRPDSVRYQGQFIENIAAEVVGRPIDQINVHRVAGSSLTSGGFNRAVAAIKAEAAR